MSIIACEGARASFLYMFKKLIANLPFNPSLINQLVFYSDRLKRERTIRALSTFLILFSMGLQMFAVIVPPEKSLAASDNHILDGLSASKTPQQNKDFILQNWDANEDIRSIYGAFGVTRDDVAAMENKTVTIFSGNTDYWTIGRNSLYAYSNVAQQYKDTQISVQYMGQNTATTSDDRFVYQRQLKAWDIVNKTGNYYVALQGKIASTGETFWIFYDCGNLTKAGKYTPPPPTPTTPVNPLSAVCSLIGPVIIPAGATTAQIPVRITLPTGSTIPKGSSDAVGDGRGLHLSVTTNGSPATWDKYKNEDLTASPPDNQSDYIALADGTNGVSYYEFNWRDGHTYRRYFVTDTQSGNFQVTLNVRINSLDRKLVVRLLDRELGQWLPHNSSCEVAISREVPPPPEAPKPALEIKKTIIDKPASLKPGDSYTYLINYRNTVNGSLAENVAITDELDTKSFDVVSIQPTDATINNGFMEFKRGNLAYKNSYDEIRITVKLKDQLSSGAQVCNASRMTADNAPATDSQQVCIGIINPCPYDSNVPDANNPNCAQPKLVCEITQASINRTLRRVTFRTKVTSTNPSNTELYGYNYDFGDGNVLTKQSAAYSDDQVHTYEPGDYIATVVVTYGAKGVEGKQEALCTSPIEFVKETPPDEPKEPPIELKPLGKSKAVKNITQDKVGEAVTKSVLKAGDVLEFTLTTSNVQDSKRLGITVSDYIGDVLDYAELDTAFLKDQGGEYDKETKKVVWKKIDIDANSQVQNNFRVKVKSPIPSTNSPSGTTTNFDCKISNEYGNEVTINIDCPIIKRIETLPNTGPGKSIFMLGMITTIMGYFFARSRLLVKELDIVRTEYAMSGGM